MRIALIGDSHSQALWPIVRPALAAAGHIVVLQEANPGWSEAKYLSSTLGAKLAGAKPDLVVYELGGNNMKMDMASYRNDALGLVQLAKQAGASVLWLGPPSSNAAVAASTSARHEATANMQEQLGLDWVDSRPYTLSNHRSDGVHFDSTGYNNWAKSVLPQLLVAASGAGSGTKLALVAAGGASLLSLFLVWLWRRRREG
jgi:hypothetical protein